MMCIQIVYVSVCVCGFHMRSILFYAHEKWIVGEEKKMEIGVHPPCVCVCSIDSLQKV